MATYTTTLDTTTGITHIAVDGSMSAADLKQYLQSTDYASRSDKVCADLTHSTFSAITQPDMLQLAKEVQHLSRPGMRGAAVVNKSVDVGIVNAFKVYAEFLNYQVTMEIFQDKDAAIRWLLEEK